MTSVELDWRKCLLACQTFFVCEGAELLLVDQRIFQIRSCSHTQLHARVAVRLVPLDTATELSDRALHV